MRGKKAKRIRRLAKDFVDKPTEYTAGISYDDLRNEVHDGHIVLHPDCTRALYQFFKGAMGGR